MSKLNRRNFVKSAVAGAAVATTLPTIAAAQDKETIRLRLQSYWGKEADAQFDAYTDNVKAATGDGIRIKRYTGGAIVPDEEMLSAVSKGTLDMCHSYAGYWPGKPTWQLLKPVCPVHGQIMTKQLIFLEMD